MTCFVQMTAFVIRPTSAYRALELGINPAWLGVIAAAFAVLPLTVAAYAGHLADRGNERASLLFGAGFVLVAAIGLLTWSSSLTALLIWNALLGVGHIVAGVGQQTLVARGDPSRADENFGMYTFAGSLGQTMGPVLLTFFGGSSMLPDTRILFITALICAVVTVVFSLVASWRAGVGARSADTPRGTMRAALRTSPGIRKQLFGAIAVSMVILAAIDLLSVYLPAWGVESGISAFLVGILLSVRSVATMLSRLGLGALVRRFGRMNLIIASTLIGAAAIFALMFSRDVPLAGVLLAIAGATLGIGQPLTMAAVSMAAPAGTVGLWLSIRLTGNSLGIVVIPPVVGAVAGAVGTAGVFGVVSLALVGVAGGAWLGRGPITTEVPDG